MSLMISPGPKLRIRTLLAVTCLLNAAFPPAHWAGDTFTRAWLSLEATRILLNHGTARGVLFPASYSTVGSHRLARRL